MNQELQFDIATLKTTDIADAMALEKAASPPPTPRRDFVRELNSEVAHYLALRVRLSRLVTKPADGTLNPLIGLAGFWLLADEVHVVTIAVDPAWKGLGLGEWLFIALLEAGQAVGGRIATLEVRPSNAVALTLYQKYRFAEVGRRKAYYSDNEDALILTAPPFESPAYQSLLAFRKNRVQSRLQKIDLDKHV